MNAASLSDAGAGPREVARQALDVPNAGVDDLATSDLLERPSGYPRLARNPRPMPARRQKFADDKLVDGVFHAREHRPIVGYGQPANGSDGRLALKTMAKGGKTGVTKRRKAEGFMRAVVSNNVRLLLAKHYPLSTNRTKALAVDAGVSLSTVQRVVAGEVGASVDVLEQIANVFQLSVYQLLVPSLDVDNPQIVHGALAEEQRLYRAYRRGQQELEQKGGEPFPSGTHSAA